MAIVGASPREAGARGRWLGPVAKTCGCDLWLALLACICGCVAAGNLFFNLETKL